MTFPLLYSMDQKRVYSTPGVEERHKCYSGVDLRRIKSGDTKIRLVRDNFSCIVFPSPAIMKFELLMSSLKILHRS